MTRTRRFLHGLSLGYINLAITTVAGLFLTRFFLRRLGETEYGYWLIASQIIGYAGLLDLGVVALLPREVAFAVGRAGGWARANDLPELIGRISRAVLWQFPLLLLSLFPFWLLLPRSWEPLRWPLAVLLGAFTVLFPLRIPSAVLNGLQDLAYLGQIQLFGWFINVCVTVLLLSGGWRLFAFAFAYAVSQLFVSIAAFLRLWLKYRALLPRRFPRLDGNVLPYLRSAGWASTSQVAQLLILGTDALIVGALFGSAAVVPYSITNRLFSVLGNQPNFLMQAALPGLAELRMAADARSRLTVALALGQAMLTITGAIAVTVIAINAGFVSWWVGRIQYGGLFLTVLFAAQLFMRHWNTTLVYTLFSFGRERRNAVTLLADGIVTVGCSVLLGRWFGIVGVPLGSIVGFALVSLPFNVRGMALDTGIGWRRLFFSHLWWQWRVALVGCVSVLTARLWTAHGFVAVAAEGIVVLAVYSVVMASTVVRPPLGDYVRPRLVAAMTWLRGGV
jgi:O-antigen/teichoic acid export membrane protein